MHAGGLRGTGLAAGELEYRLAVGVTGGMEGRDRADDLVHPGLPADGLPFQWQFAAENEGCLEQAAGRSPGDDFVLEESVE